MDSEDEQNKPQEQDLSHLPRSERRKARKQQRREQVEIERAKRRKKKIIKGAIILLGVVVVIALFLFFRSYRLKDAPEIQVTPSNYNFGSVSVAEGTINTLMTVGNEGKNNLIINNIKSTCSCTTASLIVNEEESPTFGMHDTLTDWSATLKPGEKAQLKINYNPKVHKDLRGAVTREVMIFSNDPRNKVKQLRIDAYQVD